MQERPAHGDILEHGTHLVFPCGGLSCDFLESGRVRGSKFPAQGVGEKVLDETTDKALLFLDDDLLELREVPELMLLEENTADIDIAPVLILVTPDTGWPVVFQGKPQRVNLVMTTSTVLAFAVSSQSLANGELGKFLLARAGAGHPPAAVLADH